MARKAPIVSKTPNDTSQFNIMTLETMTRETMTRETSYSMKKVYSTKKKNKHKLASQT